METLNPSRLTRSASRKRPSPLQSPIKPSAIAAAPSPAKPAPYLLPTPEKPIPPPRRQRNRAVALSLKEVKRVAARSLQGSPNHRTRSADDLSSLEHELVSTHIPKQPRSKSPVKLIAKYEMLAEFFNCMVSSIQLLRLRGSMSTFPNICASIQNLTERKFSYIHLAQMKHVFSEAVLITKVVLRDEATCCMKPELQVALQVEAVGEEERRKGETGYSALRRIFRDRLVDFANKHPQGDDVPMEMLPHPFNQTIEILPLKVERLPTESMPAETLPNVLSQPQFAVPSHMSRSFKPCFSRRTTPCEQKTSLLCTDQTTSKDSCPISPIVPVKCASLLMGRKSPLGLPTISPPGLPTIFSSPSKHATPEKDTKKGTPAQNVSTPMRLMASTPELQTPKRSRLTIGCDSPQPVKSEKRSTRTKLFRTPMKSEKRENERSEIASSSADNDDVLSFLPKELLQSIREKEKRAREEKEAGGDEAKRRQKMLARLTSMFDTILLIVQSTQRSTMTKQELLHKIVVSHTKIVDRGEAEEQLKLLQELVPDYVFERLSLSGDTLCCVNKSVSPEEIRRRLAKAV